MELRPKYISSYSWSSALVGEDTEMEGAYNPDMVKKQEIK